MKYKSIILLCFLFPRPLRWKQSLNFQHIEGAYSVEFLQWPVTNLWQIIVRLNSAREIRIVKSANQIECAVWSWSRDNIIQERLVAVNT